MGQVDETEMDLYATHNRTSAQAVITSSASALNLIMHGLTMTNAELSCVEDDQHGVRQQESTVESLSEFLFVGRELRALASGCMLLSKHWPEEASDTTICTQALKECARLLAEVGMSESRVLGDEALYKSLCSEASQISDTTAAAKVAMQLINRMRQEGYHPERGGSSYSVVLSRDEKLQRLQQLR